MKRIAAHLFLLTFFSATAYFQTEVKPAVTSSYAVSGQPVLEIKWADNAILAYQKIGPGGWFGAPQMIPGWKPTAEFPYPSAVQVSSGIEDAKVKVHISVLIGPHLKSEITVGDYLVRMNERTVITELNKFGIVPFEITLVRAPATFAQLPNVVNKTTSIQVSLEPRVSNLPGFSARFLNNSSKSVRNVSFGAYFNGKELITTGPKGNEGSSLIEPGQTYEYSPFPCPLENNLTSSGEAPGCDKNYVFMVTSVVFADGTYEGEKAHVAQFKAYSLGESVQVKRILVVLQSKFETIDEMDKAISAIVTTVDDSTCTEIASGNPGLYKAETRGIKGAAEAASVRTQKSFIKEFAAKRLESHGSIDALQPWIALSIDRYQKWIEALSR